MKEELPHAWARLHPMSPVVKGGQAVFAVLVLTASRSFDPSGGRRTQLLIDLAIAGVALLAAFVSWWVTRWRVVGTELQLETGLLRRQSIRVPLLRVQAIDVVRPLAARAFGISELRIVLAGSGSGKSRLAYLSENRAQQVRAQLLAVGAGLAPETPEAPERQLAAVPNARLYVSALLLPVLVLVAALPLAISLAVFAPDAVLPLLGGLFPLVFAFGTVVVRRVNDEFGFTLAGSPDGLRLRSGLFQTRAETIPLHRIQAVRLVEPLLWRPFGWVRLEVDVAQQRERDAGQSNPGALRRALLPVGPRGEADALLARLLPGVSTRPPAGARPPRRARWKAPLSYWLLASWYDGSQVVSRTGRLRAQTMVVPLEKVQSIRWSQGPVQRRLGLASVYVDTAGKGWLASARDRDVAQAREMLEELPGLARAAR